LQIRMAIEDKKIFDNIQLHSPSVETSILVIEDEEISTKIGSSALTSIKSEFLQIMRKSKISTTVVPELSTNYMMIGKETKQLEFFHTFRVKNNGPSSLDDLDFSLTVTGVHLTDFGVEVIERNCIPSEGNNPETNTNTCQDPDTCLFYLCSTGRIVKNEEQLLKVRIFVNHLENDEESKKLIESSINIPFIVDDENEVYNYNTVYFITDFSQHTIVQKIIDHWYVAIGIIIGIIIICIGVTVLLRFDIFNRVRIYREEVEIINSARNSRLRTSAAPEEGGKHIFINQGMNLEDGKDDVNTMEMK